MWQKEVAYLESHLIGDPTFRFTPHTAIEDEQEKTVSSKRKHKFWQSKMESESPLMRSVALKRLYSLYENDTEAHNGFSSTLLGVMKADDSWSVRLEALWLSGLYADDNNVEIVLLGMDDPYERVLRMAADWQARLAMQSLVAPLQKIVEYADEVQRVQMVLSRRST